MQLAAGLSEKDTISNVGLNAHELIRLDEMQCDCRFVPQGGL